jgi:DNA-binding NarL/FixJ family response regulator
VSGLGRVPVKTELPAAEYRFLAQLASTRKTTVGALVAAAVHVQLAKQPVQPLSRDMPLGQRGRAGRLFGPEQIEALRALHASGFSDVQIAKRLGYTQSTVQRRRNELGLPSNHPQYVPKRYSA